MAYFRCIGGNGGTLKKKNLIVSTDTNATTLNEFLVDENLQLFSYKAVDHTTEVTAYETDLVKIFYDVNGQVEQYNWVVIAKTNVTCESTNYVAGDLVIKWNWNATKVVLIEET